MSPVEIDTPSQVEADLKKSGSHMLSVAEEMGLIEKDLAKYERENIDPRELNAQIEAKKFRLETLKLNEDITSLSKRVEFRRFCWKIMEMAGTFKISFVPAHADMTAFNEGKKSVGLDLLAMLETIDPNIFAQMRREHLSDIKSSKEK